MGGPTLVTIPGTGCVGLPVMATWWPLFVRVGTELHGLTPPTLVKAYGPYSALSGTTHTDGTEADLSTAHAVSLVMWAALARRYGAPAAWPRGSVYGQPSMAYHVHLVLNDPATVAARWQLDSVFAGMDGLTGAAQGNDYVSEPPQRITAVQGIAQMRADLAIHELSKKQEDVDMGSYVFMRTDEPGNPVYILTPGEPVRHLTEQEWNLWTRLGAKLPLTPTGDFDNFNRAEVDIVNSNIQPVMSTVTATVDPAVIASAVASLPADTAQAVMAALSKQLSIPTS